jgi:uncharacterized membrane-anchored protein
VQRKADSSSMSSGLDLACFQLHPQRGTVLGEVHARPFTRLTGPLAVLRFAFLSQGDTATADRRSFASFCAAHGLTAPDASAKHHHVTVGAVTLRWEQHSEFTTFSEIMRAPRVRLVMWMTSLLR